MFILIVLTSSTSLFSNQGCSLGLLDVLIDYMIFLSPFLDVTRMPMSTVLSLSSYTLEFFAYRMLPLIYDLNGSKSRINRHLLTAGFFLKRFLVYFNIFALLFLVSP